VLFDAGETLLRPEPSFPELIVKLLEARGLEVPNRDPDWVNRALASVFRAMDDLLVGEQKHFSTSAERSRAFWTKLYTQLLAELGVVDADAGHATYLYDEFSKPEHYALFPDAMPALRELAAIGYTLGIVSNFEAWLVRLLERLEVLPLMSVVVVSGIEGIEKPDPDIFLRALKQLDAAPERAVYVGDNPRIDIEPALALGMGAVLVDRRGVHTGFTASHVVRSLEQVPAVIR
jgi:putative hydrolase of the HAD superfamily